MDTLLSSQEIILESPVETFYVATLLFFLGAILPLLRPYALRKFFLGPWRLLHVFLNLPNGKYAGHAVHRFFFLPGGYSSKQSKNYPGVPGG